MSGEAALTRTWRVGKYRAVLSVPRPKPGAAQAACIEWEPHLPPALTPDELTEYRAGRNKALSEICGELGVPAVVVEL